MASLAAPTLTSLNAGVTRPLLYAKETSKLQRRSQDFLEGGFDLIMKCMECLRGRPPELPLNENDA